MAKNPKRKPATFNPRASVEKARSVKTRALNRQVGKGRKKTKQVLAVASNAQENQMALARAPSKPVIITVEPLLAAPPVESVPRIDSMMQLMLTQQTQISAILERLANGTPATSSAVAIVGAEKPATLFAGTVQRKAPALPDGFPFIDDKSLVDLFDLTVNVDLGKLVRVNSTLSVIQGEARITTKDGAYVLSDLKPKKVTIVCITQWIEAFILFRRVRSFYHPVLQQPLGSYQTIVNDLAGTYTSALWLEYDRTFRANSIRDSVNPEEWGRLNRTLLDRCIARLLGRSSLPLCRECDAANHTEQECLRRLQPQSSRGFRNTGEKSFEHALQPFRAGPPDLCRNWNNGKCTSEPICKWGTVTPAPFVKSPTTQLFIIPTAPQTPMRADRLHELLSNHPNRILADFVLEGVLNGFDIGYTGPALERSTRNARSCKHEPLAVHAAVENHAPRVTLADRFLLNRFRTLLLMHSVSGQKNPPDIE